MKKFTLQQFKNEKIAVNTRTQKEYDSLMRFFDSKGIKWGDGKPSENNVFHNEKEKTCINHCIYANNLGYCDKNFYKKRGYTIITPNRLKEYNEFMEKPKNLTVGQAIDWMRESEDNVIEYYDECLFATYRQKITNGEIKVFEDGTWENEPCNVEYMIKYWKNIRKYKEPKKTLNELIDNKEPFEYKNNWYRFNKDGAIIKSDGGAVSFDLIREILTKIKEK